MEEEIWETVFQGFKYRGAGGPRDVLIIVSSESLEGPEIVPRKEGSLTEEDKASLESQGIPPESWVDEGKLIQARYTKDNLKRYPVVAVEYNQQAEYVRDAIISLFTDTTKPGGKINQILMFSYNSSLLAQWLSITLVLEKEALETGVSKMASSLLMT